MTSRVPRRNAPSIASQHSQGSLQSWTDDIPVCRHSGIGFSINQIYRPDGGRSEDHEFEDKFFHFRTDQDDYLYAIFDGYDGINVPNFAHQRLPAELLLGQLIGVSDDAEVKRALHQSFVTVERSYFETLDQLLAERTNLKLSLPDTMPEYQLLQQYPEEVEKLESLDLEISGGTSAIVTLIHDNKLFVANVGDSRALLCTQEPDGSIKVRQLSVDHTTENQDELLRLSQIGLDTSALLPQKLFGDKHATRTIGNYLVKGGYRDNILLRDARSEPIIAEPDIIGGLDVRNMIGFLLMYSNGLSQSLIEATGTTQANLDLAYMARAEFEVQTTLSGVAQGVVDKVVRRHHDSYLSGGERMNMCRKRDDMTLIVRNFNFPLGSHVVTSPTTVPGQPSFSVQFSPSTPPGSHPLGLTINANARNPDAHLMTPLYVQVDNGNVPVDQQRSPFRAAIGGDLTPQPGFQQPYFNDEAQRTPSESEREEDDGDSDHTRNSSSTTSSYAHSSSEESQRVFEFNRRDENVAEPDKDGKIDPYVDFGDFFVTYKAACPDAFSSQ